MGRPMIDETGNRYGSWRIIKFDHRDQRGSIIWLCQCDCGDIVVHIMQPLLRSYYQLEGMWGAKPVRVKLASAKGLAKASEPDEDDEE